MNAPAVRPIVIVGPTAAGKSAVALRLAALDARVELISADSMQVYRGMDIGTAKPTPAEQAAVVHHLIDIVDPHEEFGVAQFQHAATVAMDEIASRGGRAVVVGGTGLYVRAVVDDLDIPGRFPEVQAELEETTNTPALHARLRQLDPHAAARMEPTNRRRIVRALEVTIGSGRPFSSFGPGLDAYPDTSFVQFAVDRPRPVLDARIEARYGQQMDAGFLDEVEALAARPDGISHTARQALGYRELLGHVELGRPLDRALELANQRTRRFARRQQRWFRRDPRLRWLDGERDAEALATEILSTTAEPGCDSGTPRAPAP